MKGASWVTAMLLTAATSLPSQAQILSEQQFLDDVFADHPSLDVAEAAVAVAAGNHQQAGLFENMEIEWEREDPDIGPSQDTFRLSWRLPFDGRRHRLAAAASVVAASRSDVGSARLKIRLEMRSIFAAWYIATERESILRENLDRTARLATWLRARAEEGEAAGVDAQRLDLEVEVLAQETFTAAAEVRARRVAASTWSDLVTGTISPARPTLPPPPRSTDVGDHPELVALAHRAAAAEARHQQQQRVLQSPEVSAGWLEIRDSPQSFGGPVLGLSWPIPIFDRQQGARRAAAAEVEKAQAELQLARRRAVHNADTATVLYSDLFDLVTSIDDRAPDSDVADTMLAAFEAGETSLTDVLDALRATVAVEMVRIESLARALHAQNDLEAALGRPITPGEDS